jgi:hypothetical protein
MNSLAVTTPTTRAPGWSVAAATRSLTNALRLLRRRPALLCLLAVYALALTRVHDAASLTLGATVLAAAVVRAALIVRRGPV